MIKSIVLGGGCFWCIEAIFQRVKGVTSVESGYAGGDEPNPTYYAVASGDTGHAEVVKVEFDTEIITLDEILTLFFHLHDPTTLNKQGADVGTQYRSVVFFSDDNEKEIIKKVMNEVSSDWSDPIVTQVAPLTSFYKAEEYHQNYFNNNPDQGYCRVVISPKLTKLKEKYFDYTI